MRMETWAAFRIHSRLKMPGSSEEDRPLVDPCISRPPPRCYDPDPLGHGDDDGNLFLNLDLTASLAPISTPTDVRNYRKLLEKKVAALPFAKNTELAEPPGSPTLDLTK